jgi:hypothetical protein
MNGYWANLRPFEKRVLVGVAALFFVVLNYLFVFPYLKERDRVEDRYFQANRKLGLYQTEVSQTNSYAREVRRLESEGLEVPLEDQARHFANTINVQAGQSGVQIISYGKTSFTTNQFFIELSQTISAQSPEEPLVDFLYNLGSGNSLIRVRDLNLRPDPARQQIVATITLVASYQKQAAAKPASATPPTKGPAAPGSSKAAPLADAAAKSITSTKK